ncbi:carboxypeptidase regulatory-like domain-containing protein [Oceanithermus desulfurans]
MHPNIKGVAAAFGLALLLAACQTQTAPRPGGGPGGGLGPQPTAESGTVAGFVVNANAGEGVPGSAVAAYEAGTDNLLGTTTTASDGSFSLDVAAGAVDLRFEKEGYAGSQVLNLRLDEEGVTRIAVIQREAFNPDWPTTPPQVTLGKVADGNVYEAAFGFIPYDVTVSPAAPLTTDLIYAALGKTPGSGFITGYRELFVSTNATGDRFLDPLRYAAAGPTTFQVVAYDTNGNRTQLFRYVEVSVPFINDVDLVPPELRSVMAVTLNKQIGFFSVQPQAAPEGANLYVDLAWLPKLDFSHAPNDAPYGYRVYRSFDGDDFELIGTVAGSTTFYTDASPLLAPGRTVHYRVTAFVGELESPPSNVLVTTPLDVFDVRLTGPGDGDVGVPVAPTFTWEASTTLSGYHYYAGAVWDTLTGENAWFASPASPMLVNRTSWTWNEDGAYTNTPLETLQRGRSYEWQLIEAYALDDPVHPTAVSIAADGLGLWFPFGVASTDHFTFTTAP